MNILAFVFALSFVFLIAGVLSMIIFASLCSESSGSTAGVTALLATASAAFAVVSGLTFLGTGIYGFVELLSALVSKIG